MRETVGEAMAYLGENQVRAVHLSVDLDVLDPERWPGVSTPVHGGMTAADLVAAARAVAEGATISSMDVVELTPPEDRANETAEVAISVCTSALGIRAASPLAAA
jgi:arginase family enzyme